MQFPAERGGANTPPRHRVICVCSHDLNPPVRLWLGRAGCFRIPFGRRYSSRGGADERAEAADFALVREKEKPALADWPLPVYR